MASPLHRLDGAVVAVVMYAGLPSAASPRPIGDTLSPVDPRERSFTEPPARGYHAVFEVNDGV